MPPELMNLILTIGGVLALLIVGAVRALRGVNNQNDARKSEITQLQNDLDTERRTAREQRQKVDDLLRQLDGTNSLLREVDRTNANLTGRLTEQREIYSKQLNDQSNDIAYLRQTISERDTQIVALTKIVEDFKKLQRENLEQHTRDQETIEELRRDLGTAQRVVEQLTERVAILETQVKEMNVERAALIAERDLVVTERDALKIKNAQLDEDIKALIERLTEQENQLSALRKELAALKAPPVTASITSADPVIAPEASA